jgi:hypothetical protein
MHVRAYLIWVWVREVRTRHGLIKRGVSVRDDRSHSLATAWNTRSDRFLAIKLHHAPVFPSLSNMHIWY